MILKQILQNAGQSALSDASQQPPEEWNTEFIQIMDKLEQIESMLKKLTEKKDVLNGDELPDNGDMCAMPGERCNATGKIAWCRIT